MGEVASGWPTCGTVGRHPKTEHGTASAHTKQGKIWDVPSPTIYLGSPSWDYAKHTREKRRGNTYE